MVSTVVFAISVALSVAAGFGIGSASGSFSARQRAETECLERAGEAGISPDKSMRVCRRAWRRRKAARQSYSRNAFKRLGV